MIYLVAVHKDPDSDYGVSVPDMPGCISAGSTIDEALLMAREAMELHVWGMIEDGQDMPEPRTLEEVRRNSDFADAAWAYVEVEYVRERHVA